MSPTVAIVLSVATASASAARSTMLWTEVTGADRSDVPNAIEIRDAVERELQLFVDIEPVSRERAVRVQLVDTRRRCGSDSACITSDLADRDVEIGIVLTVDGGLSPPLVSARLLTAGSQKTSDVAVGEAEGVTAILETTGALVRKVLERFGAAVGSVVTFDVRPVDAVVLVAPPGRELEPRVFVLKPGSYRATATRPGFEPAEERFDVTSGQRAALTMKLEEPATFTSSPWFWGGVGAVVVAGVVVVTYLAVTPRGYVVCTADPMNERMCQ